MLHESHGTQSSWLSTSDVVERFLGHSAAKRIHAIECAWLERMRSAKVYVYRFAADKFETWEDANGHYVARCDVVPLAVEPVGDLLTRHAEAGIELRITPSLWLCPNEVWDADAIPDTGLRFSMVRLRNALPRT